MEAYEDVPGDEIVSSPPRIRHGRRRHELLEQAEARFRSSADRLRACGAAHEARRECGLDLLHADRGNVQLADPATGTLTIAAQHGFRAEFLQHFAVVTDDGSACGRAGKQRAQVVIADVSTDPGFAPHREIAAASGFRAVQSTPLTAGDGRLVGMLSTHYPRPAALPDRELRLIGYFGALIGERLAALLDTA